MYDYHLAFLDGNGEWEIVEYFQAADDAAANEWAVANEARMEREYGHSDWWVLDDAHENINA